MKKIANFTIIFNPNLLNLLNLLDVIMSLNLMLDKVQEFLVMFVWNLFTVEVGV